MFYLNSIKYSYGDIERLFIDIEKGVKECYSIHFVFLIKNTCFEPRDANRSNSTCVEYVMILDFALQLNG